MDPAPEPIWLVACSFPSEEAAASVCHGLVRDGYAACATLIPEVRSIYRWKGVIEQATEIMGWLKTSPERYPALEAELARRHPYEVPEIVAIPAGNALPAYARWVRIETSDREFDS